MNQGRGRPDARAPIDAIRVIPAAKESGGSPDEKLGHRVERREITMLLAEELALLAMDPASGRGTRATAAQLSPCLAALFLGELLIEGVVAPGKQANTVHLTDRAAEAGSTFAAVSNVVVNKGPKVKAVLSHMDRGLREQLGLGTWGVSALGLVEAGVLTPLSGGRGFRYKLLSASTRDAVVSRLRTSAAGKASLDQRTAMLLSMVGLAGLIATVAPDRSQRSHIRRRLDHALDGSQLKPIERVARRLAAEAAAEPTVQLSLIAS